MKQRLLMILRRLASSRYLAADGSPDSAAAEKIRLPSNCDDTPEISTMKTRKLADSKQKGEMKMNDKRGKLNMMKTILTSVAALLLLLLIGSFDAARAQPTTCTPTLTVTDDPAFPNGIPVFNTTLAGLGSVTVDHVNAGLGLQSLTVVGTPINAMVNIPAFTPGTFNPVTVSFTRINPNLPVDFTLRAQGGSSAPAPGEPVTPAAIFIRAQCAATTCTPGTTITEGDLFPGGIVTFNITSGPGSVTVDHVNAGLGLQTLTVVAGSLTNATVSIPAFTPGTFNPVTVGFTRINPNLPVDFTLRAAGGSQFATNPMAAFIRVQCAGTDTDGDGVPDSRDNCPTTPNPEKIAFSSDRDGNFEIYVMNADGSNPVRLTNHPAGDFEPSFSPDGSKIVFSSQRDGNSEIYVMNSDGTNQTRLTNNSANDFDPAFSGDGSKIVFESARDGNAEIYVMNADGSNQINLTNHPADDAEPAISDDGLKVAFTSARDGNAEIYVMDADGSNQTRLTNHPATDAESAFSGDGSKIVFESARDGNFEIYLMNANGSNQARLTSNTAFDNNPSFNPDGSKIVFTSTRDGSFEIYVMNANGSNQARLTNNTVFDFHPAWGRQLDSDNDGIGDACDPVAQCRNVTVTLAPGATSANADINDGSFDPDGDMLTLMYNPAGPYPAGQTMVTLTVDDGNGGTDSCNATVTVLYRFRFFEFSDLLSHPMYFMEANAGSDLHSRFSLSGFKGNNPYASPPPVSQRINCLNKNPIGAAQTIQRYPGDPFYNATFDFYQTTWRTDLNWAGTCRRLTLFLNDGTMQTLDFRFN